ncbi:hypothetical protein BLX87_12975 [Bacillus sp. VT-16-64]|nr:hypothetical protein BLX87_12975 [Bacillus sp. VT-16-64]
MGESYSVEAYLKANGADAFSTAFKNETGSKGQKAKKGKEFTSGFKSVMAAATTGIAGFAGSAIMESELFQNAIGQAEAAFVDFATAVLEPVLDPLMDAFSTVTGLLSIAADSLRNFNTLSTENQTTILLVAVALATLTAAIIAYNASAISAFITTGILTNAMAAFSTIGAFLASPITLIIFAIGALVGILIYLYNTNETVRAAMQTAWAFISGIIQTVITTIHEFVMTIWGQLVAWWQQNNEMILQAVQNVWNVISVVIGAVMIVIWTIMQTVWPVIKALIVSTWESIKGVIQGAINVILGIVQFFSALFTGNWSAMWDAIKMIFTGALQLVWGLINLFFIGRILAIGSLFAEGLKNLLQAMWNFITRVFQTGVDWARSVVSTGFNFISSIISTIMNVIRSVISGVWNGIVSVISTVVNTIRSVINDVFNALAGIVQSALTNVSSAVSDGINSALTAVTDMVSRFFDAGRNIVTSIADGISSAISIVTDAIDNVASRIRDFLPFSPAKEGPLRDIQKLNFGGTIAQSIKSAVPIVQREMKKLVAIPNVEPINIAGQMAGVNQMANVQMRSTMAGEMSIGKEPAYIHLQLGNTDFNTFVDDISNTQSRKLARLRRAPR